MFVSKAIKTFSNYINNYKNMYTLAQLTEHCANSIVAACLSLLLYYGIIY